MKQRTVAIIATYLSVSRRGRLTKVRSVGSDDYIVAFEDVRDGRTHLLHAATDLGKWLESFEQGRCIQPAAAICGRCDRLHVDRDVDGGAAHELHRVLYRANGREGRAAAGVAYASIAPPTRSRSWWSRRWRRG